MGGAGRGQVAVEAAFALPLLLATGLSVVQLALLQHARLLTEYAAFQAARAGAVWSGHLERMHDAALFALLPAVGRTDSLESVARTWDRAKQSQRAFAAVAARELDARAQDGVLSAGRLQVRPSTSVTARAEELDFDSGADLADEGEAEALREATLLEVAVTWHHELTVPLADWIVFASWYASRAGGALDGALDRTRLATSGGGTSGGGGERTMELLWRLARGHVALEGDARPRFFIPIVATHVMRMQSNPYRKWRLLGSGEEGGR